MWTDEEISELAWRMLGNREDTETHKLLVRGINAGIILGLEEAR